MLQWSQLSFCSLCVLSGIWSVPLSFIMRAEYREKTGTQTLAVFRIDWGQSWCNSQEEQLLLCLSLGLAYLVGEGLFPLCNVPQILRHVELHCLEFQAEIYHIPSYSPKLCGLCTHSQCLSYVAVRSRPGGVYTALSFHTPGQRDACF